MSRGYLTRENAGRVAKTVRAYERGSRDMPPIKFRWGGDEGDWFRLARFAGTWNKGETKEVEQCDESGDPLGSGDLFDVVNYAADVETPDESTYGYLGACLLGETWILMWFECDVGSGS